MRWRRDVAGVPLGLELAAPELLRDQVRTPAADVYALGRLAHELISGAPLVDVRSRGLSSLAGPLTHGVPPLLRARPDAPAELSSVIDAMVHQAPDKRPTAAVAADALRAATAWARWSPAQYDEELCALAPSFQSLLVRDDDGPAGL
jgi:serine/threonine-protein kinase